MFKIQPWPKVLAMTKNKVKKCSDEGLRMSPGSVASQQHGCFGLKLCRKYKDWTEEYSCKVIFSDEAPF